MTNATASPAATGVDIEESGRGVAALLSSPLVLVAILALTFAVYAPTLNDWFAGDDFWFLRSAKTTGIGEYALESFDFRETEEIGEFNRYRPFYPMLWRLQYEVFGLDAFGYHAVLVALHLANTAMVWFIASRLFNRTWAANLTALIFALHPAYADAVTWLSGGNRTVAAFAGLASVACFIVYRSAGRGRAVWYAAALAAYVSAILTHSSAVGLVVVLPLYAALVDGRPRDALRPGFWLPFVPFLLAAAGLAGIQAWVRDHFETHGQFDFGWGQYAIYGRYLGFAVVPFFPSTGDHFAEPWPRIIEALQGIASVAAIAVGVWLIAHRRWSAVGFFAVFWLIASLLPDTTLEFPVQGRVLYLPGAGLAMFVVTALVAGYEAVPSHFQRHTAIAAAAIAALMLVPALLLTIDHRDETSVGADQDERFADELREHVPELSRNAVLYVVNPPPNIYIFSATQLEALVEIYYGEREVRVIGPIEADTIKPSLEPGDRIFRYER